MSLELGRQGIRVNSVNPTVVLTEMGAMAWPEGDEKTNNMLKSIPLGKFATSADIATVVTFLLDNEKAAMVNGAILLVDGGCLASR